MKIRFKKLSPGAIVPTKASDGAAGYDLYNLPGADVMIPGRSTKMLRTGIAMEIPEGYMGLVFARRGMASKRGLAPANKVGVIDSDYRGEIMVAMHNSMLTEQWVGEGERMAQICFVPVMQAELEECDSLDETARGSGGFGSTGA